MTRRLAEQLHVYPWATALRLPTDHGDVWFKAAIDALRHEATLTERPAARRRKPRVPEPQRLDQRTRSAGRDRRLQTRAQHAAPPLSVLGYRAPAGRTRLRQVPLKHLHDCVQLLERRLSEVMGEQAWPDSGLGAPLDVEALQHANVEL